MNVKYSILFIINQYLTLFWYRYSSTNQEADDSSIVNQGTSSFSSKPGPSKKAQQKIDKQNAFLKFKTEQKALKEVKYPSCGLTTHARSTSNFCPNKNAKVPVCSPDERVKNFVIKMSLPNVCNNQQLVQHIKNLADYTTKILFVGSLFVNFIFIKLLDDGQVIPSIEQSLFTNIFAVMAGNGKKAPHYLKEYFTLFCELITVDRESLKNVNFSIIFSIAGKQYEVLVRNYIHETHERRSITYFLNMMSDNNSSNCCKELPVASRKAFVYFIYKQKQGSEPSWPSSAPCSNYYKEITENIASMWSKYQPDQCDSDTLYSKPHLFLKWLYFLSQEVQKKKGFCYGKCTLKSRFQSVCVS